MGKKIERFEDLKCWQAARVLVKEVYLASSKGKVADDFGMRNQIRRAALSTMNNIAEGFGRFSDPEFIRFLNISQSSALEVQSMLYVLGDIDYLDKETIKVLRLNLEKTKALTLGLIRYLGGDQNDMST